MVSPRAPAPSPATSGLGPFARLPPGWAVWSPGCALSLQSWPAPRNLHTPLRTGGPGCQLGKGSMAPPPPANPPPPTCMDRGVKERAFAAPCYSASCGKKKQWQGGHPGTEKPASPASQTYLPQGFLPSSSVFQAHVQSSQLQPHGGHIEGVQGIMLAGRREKTAATWSPAAEQPTGRCRKPQSPWQPGFSKPWQVWAETGDGSILFKHHGCTPFCAWGVFLKSAINTAGEILLKSICQPSIGSQSPSFVLGAPKAQPWEPSFRVNSLL